MLYSFSSAIFCSGDLLDRVQREAIFNDSKEYVDRPLKSDPSTILQAFSNISDNSSSTLKSFVLNWTNEAGTDLQGWVPVDWVESPVFVAAIKSSELQQWAKELNALWKNLSRRVCIRSCHTLLLRLFVPTG